MSGSDFSAFRDFPPALAIILLEKRGCNLSLQPDEIDLDGLPRTIGGGLKREPVEELLQRVQWEYSQLYYEHKRVKAELSRREPESDPGGAAKERAPAPGDATPAPPEHASSRDPSAVPLAGSPRPRDYDELARFVLSAAHRASREMRESTRRECELALKKVRSRVADLESEYDQAIVASRTELERLESMLLEMREQMRSALEALRPRPPGPTPIVNEAGPVSVLRPVEARDPAASPSVPPGRSGLGAAS